MLIIGHRGAAGNFSENTLESLQAGLDAGADMLEFDVRLTSDQIPILSHGPRMNSRTVSKTTYSALVKAGSVTTLESILDTFFGRIFLNLEFKPVRGAGVVFDMLDKKYITKKDDWSSVVISSFHVYALSQFRRLSTDVNLALLHSVNPFAFVTYQRRLQLSAVGWHRLHVNSLSTKIAKNAGIFTYVYTINKPQTAKSLEQKGIDGIVTDHPEQFIRSITP